MRVERSVLLPTTQAEAWAVLTDWERQADWMSDADRVEVLASQRSGPGVLLGVRTRILDIPAFTETLEVVGWDPPVRLIIAHRRFIEGTGTWALEAVEGGTRFTWTERIVLPAGLLGELILAAYRPVMGRLMDRSMRELRRSIVARGPARA